MTEPRNVRTCPTTGALIFRTPDHLRKQAEAQAALSAQNAELKAMLAALVAVQPPEVMARLPQALQELSQNPPESDT